jgi:hypothetical protein
MVAPVTDIFKSIIDGGVVEGWVEDTLKAWWEVYSRELEIQRGETPGLHPQPASWVVIDGPEADREVADQMPAIIIISPGLNGQRPIHDGRGQYRATWLVGVGLFVSASTREDTKNLVRFYAAVARAIMLQKSSLGGNVARTTWLDESYDDNFNFTDQLTISAGSVIFEVEVDNVVTHGAGPVADPDPGTQPGSQPHYANRVIIDLRKERIT